MTAYLTLKKFKHSIDQTFGEGNKIHKNNLIVIDDLHLQSNLTTDIIEFLRMWKQNQGHYCVKTSKFKPLGSLNSLMAHDLKFGSS